MKVLVDTHIAIWAMTDDKSLPEVARKILLDKNNIIYYSTVSVWEIMIKHSIRPNEFLIDGQGFVNNCIASGYKNLPLLNEHTFALDSLHYSENAPQHKDPFDRILISQAKTEGMCFLTHDLKLVNYKEPCIISV